MTVSVLRNVKPPDPGTTGMSRVLQDAGVTRASTIHVSGRSALAALLWLCRRGYELAAHVDAGWSCSALSADALLVRHVRSASALQALLERARGLREGGVLIVQTPADVSEPELDSMAGRVRALGYRLERRLREKGHVVLVARRGAVRALERAA